MKIYISGGAKNGKSYHAQRLAKEMAEKTGKDLYYIATMIPSDGEDQARIERHIKDREGWGFTTLEKPRDIHRVLEEVDMANSRKSLGKEGVFLLDSVTALLANEMFQAGEFLPEAPKKVGRDLKEFLERVEDAVIVSDYIFADPGPFDEYTESYRKGLALVDREVSELCDELVEVTAGIPIVYKI